MQSTEQKEPVGIQEIFTYSSISSPFRTSCSPQWDAIFNSLKHSENQEIRTLCIIHKICICCMNCRFLLSEYTIVLQDLEEIFQYLGVYVRKNAATVHAGKPSVQHSELGITFLWFYYNIEKQNKAEEKQKLHSPEPSLRKNNLLLNDLSLPVSI